MHTVTVSPKYQVVIPREVRERMNLRPGEKLQVLCFDDRIDFLELVNVGGGPKRLTADSLGKQFLDIHVTFLLVFVFFAYFCSNPCLFPVPRSEFRVRHILPRLTNDSNGLCVISTAFSGHTS